MYGLLRVSTDSGPKRPSRRTRSPYAALGCRTLYWTTRRWDAYRQTLACTACIYGNSPARRQQRWGRCSARCRRSFLNFSNQAKYTFTCGLTLGGSRNTCISLYSRVGRTLRIFPTNQGRISRQQRFRQVRRPIGPPSSSSVSMHAGYFKEMGRLAFHHYDLPGINLSGSIITHL